MWTIFLKSMNLLQYCFYFVFCSFGHGTCGVLAPWPGIEYTSAVLEGKPLDHQGSPSNFFFPFIFISWRLITLRYCSGFCRTLTWISHWFTCVLHPEPPSYLPPHPIPLGLPSAPALSTCLMHPTWTIHFLKIKNFMGSKITADGDFSHEIKRHLLLGRKFMTNLDSILKSRDITLPTKVPLVKATVFSVVMYGCESWTIKKAEHWRIDAFELWCWRRLLRVPWTSRRSNQSIL